MEARWKVKEDEMEARWKVKEADMEAKLEAIPAAIVASVRDLPYEMVCGFKASFQTAFTTIPYDKITSEFNNADRPGGGDGQLNIESGVFTCLTSGHYTVTWAYEAEMPPNSGIATDLNVNGVRLEESHLSSYHQHTGANIGEVASKTIVSYTYESSHKSSLFSILDCPPEGRRHP